MKKILVFIGAIINVYFLNAQAVSINNNGAPANNSAILDVSSTSKGMLTPRMTSAQRTSIVSPAEGLIVYDTNTRSFWYYANNTWNEISKGLTLPYAGATWSVSKVFSISNYDISNGSVAIYGQTSSPGSGYSLNGTAGVWGDNSNGAGVYGTSNTGLGILGISAQNHGVWGSSANSQFAGIYGMVGGDNGIGVMGLTSTNGIGVYGKTEGAIGKAAVFENSNISNTDTVIKVLHAGLGEGMFLNISNSSNTKNGFTVINNGSGSGIYSKSERGSSAIFEGNNHYNQSETVRIIQNGNLSSSLLLHHNNANNLRNAVHIQNSGKGNALRLVSDNSSNDKYIMTGIQSGSGGGIELLLNSPGSAADGINIINNGLGDGVNVKNISGRGVYSNASGTIGKAGVFENSNVSNEDTLLKLSHKGNGSGLVLDLSNTSNNQKGLSVINKGSGLGIYAKSEKGTSAFFESHSNTNTFPVVRLNNESSGSNALLIYQNNTNNNHTVADVQNFGMGKALNLVSNSNANNNYLVSGTQLGIGGGIELSINQPIASGDGLNIMNYGTGKGISIKSWSGTGAYVEAMEGGIAIYGKTTRLNGPAIYGSNAGANGQAIRGSATGDDGIAIYGEAGNSSSSSYAGYFRNANVSNSKNVVQIDNLGTGNFLSLTNGSGDTKTSISKAGHISTDGNITANGNITVDGNKGIIRNSGSGQLRFETIPVNVSGMTLNYTEHVEVTVNFPTPFAVAPSISIGNVSGNPYSYTLLNTAVGSVTTTSCKFVVNNQSAVPITMGHTWRLILIGQD